MVEISDLWNQIKSTYLNHKIDLETFRQPGNLNSRLASWEPRELSLRWYKSFLGLAVSSSSDRILSIYAKIDKPNIGNPVVIGSANGLTYNLDFLLACQEIDFLEDFFLEIAAPPTICEIGAGFGRTCQAILSIYPETESYTIVDFPEMLSLQRRYLELALEPEIYNKISFLSCESVEKANFDLVIQIDGFQEMEKETIDRYYKCYLNIAKYIFVKNPIGKYDPIVAGLENINLASIPYHLGLSRDIIDIWDVNQINKHLEAHNERYRPESHKLVKCQNDRLFPHLILQMYAKNP